MEEIKKQLGEVAEGVKNFNSKAADMEKAIGEVKNEVADVKKAAVTKDEFLKLKEAQEEMLAKANDLKDQGKMHEKSFGQYLHEALVENTDELAKFARKEKRSAIIELKAVGDMTFSNNFGTASQSVSMFRPGIIENPNRKVHIRDLVPQGTMTGSTFYYMKENGAGEGAITTVAEGATKPQIDIDLVEASAIAETIAGWLRISTKMLDDVQGLSAFLQNRLREKLLVVEDAQLLNGDGTSPNISGITDTGNFTAASGAATIDVEQLIQAISQLEELDREANGILLRPSDYYNILLTKASGSGEYDLPLTSYVNGQLYLAGVPVYRSTAMTVDKFIVGDWRMGAMLLQRQAPVVEFFREDGTNVRENKVTVRIEERVAFPIFGNNYFIYGDFGNVA